MGAPERPAPSPRGEERRYFTDLAERRLPVYRCAACDRREPHPFVRCPGCGGGEAAREWAVGTGVVHSFTVLHRPGHPGFADRVPYTIVLVDLDEGVRTLADLRDVSEEPEIGMAVRVAFEERADGTVLPYFTPAVAG